MAKETMQTVKEVNYQLEVLKANDISKITFLTRQDLLDNGIHTSAKIKSNTNGKKYLSTKNDDNQPTSAIYLSKKASLMLEAGAIVDFEKFQFVYNIEKDYFSLGLVGAMDDTFN